MRLSATTLIKINDNILVEVIPKKIKNIHLRVHQPEGRVTLSAPTHMEIESIRAFLITKINWILKQQNKIKEHPKESEREFLNQESHFVWGECYLLNVVEVNKAPRIELIGSQLIYYVKSDWSQAQKLRFLDRWYRGLIRDQLDKIVPKWEGLVGVKANQFLIQKMKTLWGSCNTKTHTIRLNSELAKKPKECLEYVLVHELMHLIEPSHNRRFVTLMDQHMPDWKALKKILNNSLIKNEDYSN
jgi:predicted metal-dependent hydrolase